MSVRRVLRRNVVWLACVFSFAVGAIAQSVLSQESLGLLWAGGAAVGLLAAIVGDFVVVKDRAAARRRASRLGTRPQLASRLIVDQWVRVAQSRTLMQAFFVVIGVNSVVQWVPPSFIVAMFFAAEGPVVAANVVDVFDIRKFAEMRRRRETSEPSSDGLESSEAPMGPETDDLGGT